MKIIKKPDVSSWSYVHTCINCDSELEVSSKDLKHTHYAGDMRESAYDSFSAVCMVCSESFKIPSNQIPKLVQIEAKNRTDSHGNHYLDR